MPQSLAARAAFHEPHLLRVSRSFAYGIGRLDLSLKAAVGLGYLICRILDTIEDAPWANPKDQEAAFSEFNQFLKHRPSEVAVTKWRNRFAKDFSQINEGEQLLLNDAFRVFTEFHALSEGERKVMLKPVLSMSAGMKYFTQRTRDLGRLKLKTLTEANAYCLFVAGVVGELLTGLVGLELKKDLKDLPRESYVDGCHFGLFLQKINLLKDQWGDEKQGRYLVPNRKEMLLSVRTHAEKALQYLLSIPLVRTDYRLFCAWALYLGLATLPILEGSTADESAPAKLSRTRALMLGTKIEFAIRDDNKLRALFNSLVGEAAKVSDLKIEAGAADLSNQSALAQLNASEGVLQETLPLYEGEMNEAELTKVLLPEA